MDEFFNNKPTHNKPEYGSKEYMRLAQQKHYEKYGKQKAKDRYYNTKYGKEKVITYKSLYGGDFIKMLKIDMLKNSLSDSSSESSEDDNSQLM